MSFDLCACLDALSSGKVYESFGRLIGSQLPNTQMRSTIRIVGSDRHCRWRQIQASDGSVADLCPADPCLSTADLCPDCQTCSARWTDSRTRVC